MQNHEILTKAFDYFIEFMSKWSTYVFGIVIGLAGKIGVHLVKQDKMTFWQLLGSFLIAAFIGFLASVYCSAHCPDQAAYMVPIATLVSDRITLFIWVADYTPLLQVVTKLKANNKNKP